MDEYDTGEFKATLDFLTMRTHFGTFNESPMIHAYKKIMSAINNGEAIRLYRYYSPNERNITDIENNRVHLSTPAEFDDVFDCQPVFDLEKIRKDMEEAITASGVTKSHIRKRKRLSPDETEKAGFFRHALESFEKNKAAFINTNLDDMNSNYEYLRNAIGCTCFSETPSSSIMWSKYAKDYTGFVASYDINAMQVRCCCNDPTCIKDNVTASLVFILCPVFYDGRFDMSSLAFNFSTPRITPPYPTVGMLISLIHSTIHKTQDWSSQREWRLFTWLATNSCPHPSYAHLKAKEIILGPQMDPNTAKQLTIIGEKQNIQIRHAIANIQSDDNELRIMWKPFHVYFSLELVRAFHSTSATL